MTPLAAPRRRGWSMSFTTLSTTGRSARGRIRTDTPLREADFHTTLCYHSHLKCCSLDYVFTISFDLGGSYIVSTHL